MVRLLDIGFFGSPLIAPVIVIAVAIAEFLLFVSSLCLLLFTAGAAVGGG